MNVLITGGSRGIGASAVRLFRQSGHNVAFSYLHSREEAQRLAAQTGAFAFQADCASWADSEAFTDAAIARFGAPELLICNAAKAYTGLFQLMGEEKWRSIIDTDLTGPAGMCSAVIPHMVRRQKGCIILVSSMWGQVGASCEAAYSAAKAGIIGLTKALAKELGPSGIRVNCIAPGVIDTEMNAHLRDEDLDALREETPLGRLGKPEEVAAAMAYLASAEFVTGQILAPNGGFVI